MAAGFPETRLAHGTTTYATIQLLLASDARAAIGRQALCRRSVPTYAIFLLLLAAAHMH